jgi:hypothetical protein
MGRSGASEAAALGKNILKKKKVFSTLIKFSITETNKGN